MRYPETMAATTRWLSEEEQRTWRLFLQACESVFSATDAQLIRDSGLPHGYYEILVHLSEAPNRALRMTQLARASTYSKSRLSHAVARLEERSWVQRRGCEARGLRPTAQPPHRGVGRPPARAPRHPGQAP